MFDKIAEFIKENDNFILIPHRNPDGDCLGSVCGLLLALRGLGKTAYISLPEEPSSRLSFLWSEDYRTPEGFACDACIAVDVAATYMMVDLYDSIFARAPKTACIDHHGTNAGYAQVNCIVPGASAAGEIVFELARDYLGCEMTPDICTCLYSAITSDTGCFRYSNTTAATHNIAAYLVESGIDAAGIVRILFETKSFSSVRIQNDIVETMEFFCNGKICVASVDQAMLDKYDMTFAMIDDYASLPRNIEGVEVGVFLKVKGDDEVKASLRSNEYADVSSVAAALGGGGHKRAAGVTVNGSLSEAKELIIGAIEKELGTAK